MGHILTSCTCLIARRPTAWAVTAIAELKAQEIPRWPLLAGFGVDNAHALNQAAGLEIIEMPVERRASNLAVIGEPGLCWKTSKVWIEPVTQMPKYDLGCWL